MRELTVERLREVLDYCPETGVFTRKVRGTGRFAQAGRVAGGRHNQGYVVIGIDGRSYLAHRLAWLYVKGLWPQADIDHIDGNRSNNQIHNLRDVTRRVNSENQVRPKSNNTSGFLGVSWDAGRNRWKAQIKANGRVRVLARTQSPEEAYRIYVEAKRKLHEGCTV